MSAGELEEGELAGEVNVNWEFECNLDPLVDGHVSRVFNDMQGPGDEQLSDKLDRAQKRRLKKLQKKGVVAPQLQSSEDAAAPARGKAFVDVYGTNVSRKLRSAAFLQVTQTVYIFSIAFEQAHEHLQSQIRVSTALTMSGLCRLMHHLR
jgi:hypothetical protein